MKIRLTILLFLTIAPLQLFAQGFDWQYSSRLPSHYPDLYLGLSGKFENMDHFSDLSFLEAEMPCCSFDRGEGQGYSVGLAAEYWPEGTLSLFASLAVSIVPAEFSKIRSEQQAPDDQMVTEFLFEAQNYYTSLEIGGKTRLFETHFFAGASLLFAYLLSSEYTYTEQILSPDDYFQNTPDPLKRDISTGQIPQSSDFLLMPGIRLGYDLNLGHDKYASLYVNAAYSLTMLSREEEWRHLTISLGINIYHGFRF